MSQAGSIAGTAGYMSPEQAAGEIELGPPADVYALGMILREILTGKPPSLPERMGVLAPIPVILWGAYWFQGRLERRYLAVRAEAAAWSRGSARRRPC